jgi:glycosyltransferase involved in cell wall biosynthesis
MSKISIITVNLNNIKGLQSTIESVIAQTYADKEYIIIDGGSIDRSLDLIKKQSAKITYWVSEPDGGIYDAMNKGISLANGEWIIFMNSGDIFIDNQTLDNIFNNKTYDNVDVIYGNTLYKDSNKLLIAPDKFTKNYFFSETLCHQSIFTNANSFKKIGKYNLEFTFIADREWLLRAKVSKMNFQYVNEIISKWDSEGFCKDNAQLVIKEINIMRNLHFNIFENSTMLFLKILFKFWHRIVL